MIQKAYPWQVVSFFAALLIYALFSSPTPDDLRLPEFLVAGLLAVSMRVENIHHHRMAFTGLFFGLTVPVSVSAVNGNNLQDILRDIIPFFFLFMPLFYGWIARQYRPEFIAGVCGVGLIFALRTVWGYRDILGSPDLWGQGPPVDLLYLANSPEVLFSALLCLGMGGRYMAYSGRPVWAAGFVVLAVVPILSMALMMQRAGLGMVVLTSAAWLAILFYVRPVQGLALGGCVMVGCALIWPLLSVLIATLLYKTEMVGLNSRGQEWGAVIDILTDKMDQMVVGLGWGGRFENPAVGGLNVNYTHSLISSLLLKTGLFGAVVIGVGFLQPVICGLRDVYRQGKVDIVVLGAVLSPFLISGFLYASYKSLGFGLIITVFSTFLTRKLEKKGQDVQ